MNKSTLTAKLRVIGAIALKDIGDSIRNKTTLSLIIGVAFIVLSAQALPMLLKLAEVNQVAIYDAGDSAYFPELRQDENLRIVRMRSEELLQEYVRESSSERSLGLILPVDFDAQVAAGGPVSLAGYKLHWNLDRTEVETAVSRMLSQVSGVSVQVTVEPMYPLAGSGGRPSLVAMSLVLGIVSVSGVLIPHLLIEEKENHTMEALLVSPATTTQMVLGKGLAGLVYGLAVGLVVLALNGSLVTNWAVALLVIVLGAVFAVAVGLLFGSLFDDVANLNLWLGLMFALAFLPVVMSSLSSSGPSWLQTLLPLLPTSALDEGSRLAFVETVPWQTLLSNSAVMLAWAGVLFAAVVGVLRRNESRA